tara:strand:+ start:360 stop:863 length:504 start_codon:yes stop_codon:yes gene_type:complete
MSTVKVEEIQHPSNSNNAVSVASDSSVSLKHSGSAKLTTTSTGVSITGACSATSVTGTSVEDSKGNLRSIPNRNESSAYTLVAADAGKCITADDGVTVPANVFAAGDLVTIINNAGSDKTITQGSGLTMRDTGNDGSTGNVSVKTYSMSTLLFISTTLCYFSTTNKA